MIRLYLDCGCVFVQGYLDASEVKMGRSYCCTHTDGKGRARLSRIVKACELKKTNRWGELEIKIYPPLIVEKAKTVEGNIESV